MIFFLMFECSGQLVQTSYDEVHCLNLCFGENHLSYQQLNPESQTEFNLYLPLVFVSRDWEFVWKYDTEHHNFEESSRRQCYFWKIVDSSVKLNRSSTSATPRTIDTTTTTLDLLVPMV